MRGEREGERDEEMEEERFRYGVLGFLLFYMQVQLHGTGDRTAVGSAEHSVLALSVSRSLVCGCVVVWMMGDLDFVSFLGLFYRQPWRTLARVRFGRGKRRKRACERW
jgi:hypothetical protein